MTELPDEAIEAFFLGHSHDAWARDEALASLADEVLIGATGPAPRPSSALLAFLGDPGAAVGAEAAQPLAAVPPSQPDSVAAIRASDRGADVVPFFRRRRFTVGIAAAAGVAAAALAAVGTTGALPQPVMQAVSWVFEAVTPFELDDPDRPSTAREQVPQYGPTSAVPGGSIGPVAGLTPAGPAGIGGQPAATTPPAGPSGAPRQPAVTTPADGPGGAPGRPAATSPATPPVSTPPGAPGPVQLPGASVDRAGPSPMAPSIPLLPYPPTDVSPPAGGGSATPPTTSDSRAGQVPVGGTAPATVARRSSAP